MGETVDVLVVGQSSTLRSCAHVHIITAGEYGSGRRGGGSLSSLICAVVDDRRNSSENERLKYFTLFMDTRMY